MRGNGRVMASGLCLGIAVASGSIRAQEPAYLPPNAALEAGAAAAFALMPRAAFDSAKAAPEDLAGAVFEAMVPHLWQPIETAPRDAEILLGLQTDTTFQFALGQWQVLDEPVLEEMTGGAWSTAAWWGTEPTHWAPIPPPPKPDR